MSSFTNTNPNPAWLLALTLSLRLGPIHSPNLEFLTVLDAPEIGRRGVPVGNQTFRTVDYSYHGLFVPSSDYSYHPSFLVFLCLLFFCSSNSAVCLTSRPILVWDGLWSESCGKLQRRRKTTAKCHYDATSQS